jgi:UDPglucose 6-dehydrogenase
VKVAAWGLAFKANTDDVRDSPAVSIIGELVGLGASVRCYDPKASAVLPGVELVDSALAACDGADLLVVLTEWPEFVAADLVAVAERLRLKQVVDTRNVLDRDAARSAGLHLRGVGR